MAHEGDKRSEGKVMDCAACGEPAYCTEQEDGDWVCAGCLEKEENNEEWDEMLIDDALTTD